MKQTMIMLLVGCLALSGGCSRRPPLGKWQRQEAADGSFAIKIPGTCSSFRHTTPVPGGEIELVAFESITPEAMFTAGYSEYPQPFLAELERLGKHPFALAREAIITGMKGVLLDSSAGQIKNLYGTYPTRTLEWEIALPDQPGQKGLIIQKLVFSKSTRRMYLRQVMVPLEKREDYEKIINEFFYSFEFHEG